MKLDKIKQLIDFYFSPWGAAKAAKWEEIAGDGVFGPERALELIRDILKGEES